MNALESAADLRPAGMNEGEWQCRLELAACYRLFDWLGWSEMIFNHITLRVPGGDESNPHYLINPYGLHYSEVTATNLVKIDRHGNKIDASPYPLNPAGFVIHSAVHSARHDAHCVMHTHTTATVSVACQEGGLRFDNFYAALVYGQVAYHAFEGVTTNPGECPRLVASLGERNVLILRNHGPLVCGASVPAALQTMWFLQRACEVQVTCDAMNTPNLAIRQDVLERNAEHFRPMTLGGQPGRLMFDAILRRAGIRYVDIV
ncbi:class II aldolase/adducin family protein [Verticiella sediminum]|uniref:Class II aldolase/adducin family protein n=1 Tax=Verticiella sediminum TaxID=1247510 RepID=A0A556ACH0_9BURK|nr:class II aldolase/adducin family protein [Verticiella sediminum]TSH90581.1 class II aldolase/adducin family protein [Verticiella sediminum]